MMNRIPYNILEKFVFRTSTYPTNLDEYNHIINDLTFKEGLYLASSNLYNLIYIKESINFEDLPLKLKHTLLKYIQRAKGRCTPFGLFAGCGTGVFSEKSNLTFRHNDLQSKTKLDMNLLFEISRLLANTTNLKERILFKPNDSILRIYPLCFRYVEHKYVNCTRKYFLSEIKYEDYLEEIINFSNTGTNISTLIGFLIRRGFPEDESKLYVEELIKNTILVPNKDFFVTSNAEPIDLIINKINVLGDKELESFFCQVKKKLEKFDQKSLGRNAIFYDRLEKKILKIAPVTTVKQFFHCDLSIKAKKATLSREIYDTALEGFVLLNKLTNKSSSPLLDDFRNNFLKRYESEEIPLLEALDVDIGVGFRNIDENDTSLNPLLKNLFLAKQQNVVNSKISFSEVLMEKHSLEQVKEIEISDDDIIGLEPDWQDMPNTMFSLIEVVKAGNDGNLPKIIMRTACGSSAAKLLTRFCHSNKEIYNIVNEIIAIEDELISQECIIAEIVHLPQNRLGNVIHRPILRNHELTYLTDSQDHRKTLCVSDIMVSIKNGKEIVLRSRRLDKRIIPILTSAHNFKYDSLPIYEFLCHVQTQNQRNHLSYDFGLKDSNKIYIPRIRYKNIILSPAKWQIKKENIKKLINKGGAPDLIRIRAFLKKIKVPERVYICEGDNKLLIDFRDENQLNLFISETSKRNSIVEEYLFEDEDMLINNDGKIHTNQIILSFVKNTD